MVPNFAPIGSLTLKQKTNHGVVQVMSEQIYGGYANQKGEIRLFGENGVYRVDVKRNSVQKRPQLNAHAQARYEPRPPAKPSNTVMQHFAGLATRKSWKSARRDHSELHGARFDAPYLNEKS